MEPNSERGPHIAWRVLAVADALVLAYVIWNAPWGMNLSAGVQGDYAFLVKPFTLALDLGWNALAAAFAAAVAYAIARDIKGAWRARPWQALSASLPLVLVIALAAWLAHRELARLFGVIELPDRMKVFDALAYANAKGESTGARIVFMAAAAYLGEKYLLRWWNLRWPVSIVALAMLGWPLAFALQGEAAQRAWVQAQEWRAMGKGKTWLQALQSCQSLGAGWRLGRAHELPLYLATEPQAARGLRESLWTPMTSELGRAAVVVSPQPRRTGFWRSNEIPHRDQSACETDAQRSPGPLDWFARMRPDFCASAPLSESMFVSTEQRIAGIRGYRETPGGGRDYIAAQATAAAICVKPSGEALKPRRRAFPKPEEFTDAAAFLDRMRAACNPRIGGSDAAACAAFGAQEPASSRTPPSQQ